MSGTRHARADREWRAWRDFLWGVPPDDRETLEARLLSLTPVIRARLAKTRALAAEWEPAGVEVLEVAMLARGGCSPGTGSREIFVNREDEPTTQRFTVAHELAHLLLAEPPPRRHVLRSAEEEDLCDRFAGQLLIPPEERVPAERPTPDDVLRLCGRLRLNVRPVLRAVGEQLAGGPYHLLLARWRGHRQRPLDEAFRVESAAGNAHVFIPHSERLVSMGLKLLAAQSEGAKHGARLEGVDDEVTVRLWGLPGEQSSGVVQGSVAWEARRQGIERPYILAVLDLSSVLAPELVSSSPHTNPFAGSATDENL